MSTALVRDPLFVLHRQGSLGHPERPERLEAILDAIHSEGLDRRTEDLEARPATPEEITSVHAASYLEQVLATKGREYAYLDPDTSTTEYSSEAALAAAGGAIDLALKVYDREFSNGFALLRPPGHHAMVDRAMGFCLFNNIALAAAQLIERRGLERVAIVDFDVHHGNGTNFTFYERRDVLFVSTHQYPHYPGTGRFRETGMDEGKGYSVNIPMPAHMGDDEYLLIYRRAVLPLLESYQPQMILVSAGFDGHERDLLASEDLTTGGYITLMNLLKQVADRLCDGRLVYYLEGGYDLTALSETVTAGIRILLGEAVEGSPIPSKLQGSVAGLLMERLRKRHAIHWDCLSEE